MNIDLEKYNLEEPENVKIVLQMIDDKLATLR